MRARLTLRLLSLVISTVLLIIGTRSCLGATGGSGPAIDGLVRQGVAGVCGDAGSVGSADNTGAVTAPSLASGAQGATLKGLAQLPGLGSSALSCPTTTTSTAP